MKNYVISLSGLRVRITTSLTQCPGHPIIENYGRRKDFDITNSRNQRIKCSYFQPLSDHLVTDCVIYLHSLNGSRLQSAKFAPTFLEHHIGFANLDFSGSGKSEGDFVSLGFHEKDDVLALTQYLANNFKIRKFSLWGRSMGAVTAFKFAQMYSENIEKYRKIQWKLLSIVVDSPFSSLNKLAIQIAEKKVNLPAFFLKAGFLLIKNSVEQRAKFKFQDLQVLNFINKLYFPMLILASKDDELINYKHSQSIYQNYKGQKQFIYLKGRHNQCRDAQTNLQVINFFKKHFKQRERKISKQSLLFIKQNIKKLKNNNQNTKSNDNITFYSSECKLKNRSPSFSPLKKSENEKNIIFATPELKTRNLNENYDELQTLKKKLEYPQPASTILKYRSSALHDEICENSINFSLINLPSNQGIHLQEKHHYNIANQKKLTMKKKLSMANNNFPHYEQKNYSGNKQQNLYHRKYSTQKATDIDKINQSSKNLHTLCHQDSKRDLKKPIIITYAHKYNEAISKTTKKPELSTLNTNSDDTKQPRMRLP